jgi:hypothetical protein
MKTYESKKQNSKSSLYTIEESLYKAKDLADFSNGKSAFLLSGGAKMRRSGKRGQSVLEYVIILTAIIAGIVLASGAIKDRMGETLSHAGGEIEEAVRDDLTFE